MRPAIVPHAVALFALATLTAATIAAAGPPRRPADARALAQPPAPAVRPYVRPIDRWLGETRAVAVNGDFAYYSVGRAVAVADIRDPAGPQLVGRSAPLKMPGDIAEARPIEEVAAGDGTVWTITPDAAPLVSAWDVSEPSAVRLVATVTLGANEFPIGLDARGEVAVVSFEGVWPDHGVIALRRTARGIEMIERWLVDDMLARVGDVVWRSSNEVLVALGGGGLVRLAVAESASGSLGFSMIGSRAEPKDGESARRLTVDGCRAYSSAAVDTEGEDVPFWIFDVCGDGPPELLVDHSFSDRESLHPAGLAARTLAGRNYVFVADSGGGLRAIDATDPRDVHGRTTEIYAPITGQPVCFSDVAAAADRLVVAGCGLHVLGLAPDALLPVRDGAILSAPSYRKLWSGGPWYASMAVADDGVLIAHGNVLSVIDPGGSPAPTVIGRVGFLSLANPIHQVNDLAVAHGTAWVAPQQSSAVAVDLRDPRAPRVIGKLDGLRVEVIAATDRLVAASIDGQVQMFDVTDPSQPRRLSGLPLDVPQFGELAFVGDRLVVSAGIAGLNVIDVRDPNRPTIIGQHSGVFTSAMAVADGLAVALGGAGLVIYRLDAINDGSVRLESSVPLPEYAWQPTDEMAIGVGHAADRRLAIVMRGTTLTAVDITDPSHPIIGNLHRLRPGTIAMTVSGDRAFLFGPQVGAEFSVFELGALRIAATLALPFLANLNR